MATLLDKPRHSPEKQEQFIQNILAKARRRLRLLDFFTTGLLATMGGLGILIIWLWIDRYFATPRGLGWGVLAFTLLAMGLFVWARLFRGERRQINPYYAARLIEREIENNKNSLVSWVDFEDEPQIPASIRTALAQRAAKDLKGFQVEKTISDRRILWYGIVTGLLAVMAGILALLPDKRTEITLVKPKTGDVTVFNNQDVRIEARLRGRIPKPDASDAPRVRIWYNPDDPVTYEDRPLTVTEEDRRTFGVTIPAKQVRAGFLYQVLAGSGSTPQHKVTCKIIPEFTGFDVTYQFPKYLKRESQTSNDPNLLAPYGSTATLIAHTNREVQSGYLEIEGQALQIDGKPVEGTPNSLSFQVPILRETHYRIKFITTDGDTNFSLPPEVTNAPPRDPPRFRLQVVDPKPVIRSFDIRYEYPAYTRWKNLELEGIREPFIEAIRGSKITLTARTNRGVQSGTLRLNGLEITGTLIPEEPMWVQFVIPHLDREGAAQVTFVPSTGEPVTEPILINFRLLDDLPPVVVLDEPQPDQIELPANGTLSLKGSAHDDFGINKMTLRLKVIGDRNDIPLTPKPFRKGISFYRKEDNSWPLKLDYQDLVKLDELRGEKDATFRILEGMIIEYWLEAEDNRDIPPGPNVGKSKPKRIKVLAPLTKPEDIKKNEQRNNELKRNQAQFENKQDQNIKNENRQPMQPPPPGAEMGMPMQGMPMDGMQGMQNNGMMGMQGIPMEGMQGMQGMQGMPMGGMPNNGMMGMDDPRTKQVEEALNQLENEKKPAQAKPDTRPDPMSQAEPGESRPQPKPEMGMMGMDPLGEARPNPNMGMMDPKGMEPTGEPRSGMIDNTKEEKGASKPAPKPMGMGEMGMEPVKPAEEKPSYGGPGGGDSANKPDPQSTPMMPDSTENKGASKPKPQHPEQSGDSRPDREITRSESKPTAPQEGPEQAGSARPKERPPQGEARTPPKNDPDEMTRNDPRNKPQGRPDAEARPDQGMGQGDDTAKGGTRGAPGETPEERTQRELDQELGQLDRELNSKDPKSQKAAEDRVDRLMRDPKTRQQTRDHLEKKKEEAKDELTKKKTQDALDRGNQAAKEENEKKTDELTKKMRGNEAEKNQAQQDLQDLMKDPQAKKDLQDKLDQMKKNGANPKDIQNLEEAMKKAEQANNAGKPDPEKLKDIADKLKGMDPKAQEDAKKDLAEMLKDPKKAQEAMKNLKEMAKNAKSPEEKQNLEDALKAAQELAKKDPKDPKGMSGMGMDMANNMGMMDPMGMGNAEKPDPEKLKEIADKLKGMDPKAQEDAKKDLAEMLKDPKKREEVKKALKEMAKDSPMNEKNNLDDVLKQAEEMAKQGPPPLDPTDLADLMKDLAKEADPQKREQAKQKLEEQLKDPQNREKLEKAMEEMRKNYPEGKFKKWFDDFRRQVAGSEKVDPWKSDPADPRNKLKAAELLLEKFKRNITNEEFVKNLGWTKEDQEKFILDQEKKITDLRNLIDAMGPNMIDRTGTSGLNTGPSKVVIDPKEVTDPLRGSRYSPPGSYGDTFKRLTNPGAKEK
jgi:hypothetical protein